MNNLIIQDHGYHLNAKINLTSRLCQITNQSIKQNIINTVAISSALTGIYLTVRKVDDSVYVTFRGTEFGKLNDLKTIANSEFERAGPGLPQMHAGFLKAFASIKGQLIREINNYNPRYIYFCGHSMGGALAQMAHYILHQQDYRLNVDWSRMYSITFGSPRFMGQWRPPTYMAYRTLRIVNGTDPVPNLPLRFTGYKHIGDELLMTPFGVLYNPGTFRRLIYSKFNFFSSHYLENYRHSIINSDFNIFHQER